RFTLCFAFTFTSIQFSSLRLIFNFDSHSLFALPFCLGSLHFISLIRFTLILFTFHSPFIPTFTFRASLLLHSFTSLSPFIHSFIHSFLFHTLSLQLILIFSSLRFSSLQFTSLHHFASFHFISPLC